MIMLVVSLLLLYVGWKHVKPKFLSAVCILAGSYEAAALLFGLAHHLLHN